MAQYIDKSAVVAEIERKINELSQLEKASYEVGLFDAYKIILSFIDTLKVKEVNGTTAEDRGMAEEIIINLKRVEHDYHIDLTKEMEWLRNKTKKGE